MKKINNKGFTLVEILGTIVIIGILMGMGIVAYSRYRNKANTTSYKVIEKNAISAAEEYFIDNPNKNKVTLDELVNESYLETIQDPASRNDKCTGEVSIIAKNKKGERSIEKNMYMAKLYCKAYENCHIEPGNLSCTTDGGITTDGKETYYDTGITNVNIPRSEGTYAIRLKFNDFNANKTMKYFGNWDNGGGGLGLNSKTNTFFFSITQDVHGNKLGLNVTSNVEAMKDTWYIVVGTYGNRTARLYLNGALIASKPMSGEMAVSQENIIVGADLQPKGTTKYNTNITVKDILILSKGIDDSNIAGFTNPNQNINYSGEGIVFSKSF